MLPVSLALALGALVFRLVSPAEIRTLLDLHLLSLFLVLILAVECLRRSGLVEAVVGKVLSRVRSERTLAALAILTTGAVSAMVTNDVALLLVVPFTILGVFSALFVGVEGLRRSALFATLDPVALLGATPAGFVLSGALLSQFVSNVPAAILLAPAAARAGGGVLFTALLYGVNAGGCGTPISSLANLIGAGLYLRGRTHRAPFWRLFLAVSFTLLVVALAFSLLAVRTP